MVEFNRLWEDNYLIENEFKIYSVSSANIAKNGETWEVYISKEKKGLNWIPLRGNGGFYITLRLYNPESFVYDKLHEIELPKIIKEGADESTVSFCSLHNS